MPSSRTMFREGLFAGGPVLESRQPGFSSPETSRPARNEWRYIGLLQAIFLAIALIHLDGPFVSTHFVRQCFTFDVAQHVFHEGLSAVVTPKGSFTQLSGPDPDDMRTPLQIPAPRYTIVHMEFPFFGVLGWPAAQVFPDHERAVVRMIAVAFSILSIRLIYLILRGWLAPPAARLGAALWTFAPLVLHFGQVGMPDILATTGIAAALYASLRGNIPASSAAFLFTLLAKLSAIPYGLPVLIALAVARRCASFGSFAGLALTWGMAPLLGVIYLILSGLHTPPGSWVIVGGYQPGLFGPLHFSDMTNPRNAAAIVFNLFPCGCGLIGLLGLIAAVLDPAPHMNRALKLSIVGGLIANYLLERIVWFEPQYSVPVIFFLILAASFGFPALLARVRENRNWLMVTGAVLLIQATMTTGCAYFLKSSRIPNYRAIAQAATLTPPDARIVAFCTIPNQVPPVWLHRNTLNFQTNPDPTPDYLQFLQTRLGDFHRAGFDYLIVFDSPTHTNLALKAAPPAVAGLAAPSSPTSQFLDQRYRLLYRQDHVALYSLVK